MTPMCQPAVSNGTAYQLFDILLYIRLYLHQRQSDI